MRRPWGFIQDILPYLSVNSWDLVNCISTEDRCISAAKNLIEIGKLGQTHAIEVLCHEDHPDKEDFNEKLSIQRSQWDTIFYRRALTVEKFKLLSEIGDLYKWYNEHIKSNNIENLILDISCFPKRFFFPLVKQACSDDDIKNFVACYTVPETYGESPLTSMPKTCGALPGFSGELITNKSCDLVLIGIGHSAMAFPYFLSENSGPDKVELLLPFPPGPPSYQKNWKFVKRIYDAFTRSNYMLEPTRVSARNVSAAFDIITQLTENGTKRTWLAPYGPKPMSLAMCLYACLVGNCAIYYTQPRNYNPDYSSGVEKVVDEQGKEYPKVYSYVIKLEGQKVYAI